jgi:hypothetical protein
MGLQGRLDISGMSAAVTNAGCTAAASMTRTTATSDKPMKYAVHVALVVCFVGAQMLAPTFSLADVLRCKIEGYNEDIFIATSPDTNQNDRSIRPDRHLARHRQQSHCLRRPQGC